MLNTKNEKIFFDPIFQSGNEPLYTTHNNNELTSQFFSHSFLCFCSSFSSPLLYSHLFLACFRLTVTPGRGLQSSFFALLSAATVGGGGVAAALGKLPAAPSTPASLALAAAAAGFFRFSFSSFSFRRIWYSTIIRHVSMKKNTCGKGEIRQGKGTVILGSGLTHLSGAKGETREAIGRSNEIKGMKWRNKEEGRGEDR